MKWRCDKCGHEQPRHPATKPEEMPLCTQYRFTPMFDPQHPYEERGKRDHTGKYIPFGSCGGEFKPVN